MGLSEHGDGEGFGSLAARIELGDESSASQDEGGVTEGDRFAELVRDVEDRAAVSGEVAEIGEKSFRLRRGESRRRLVKNQKRRRAEKTTYDLELATLSRRQIPRATSRLESESETNRERRGGVGERRRRHRRLARVAREHEIFRRAETLDEIGALSRRLNADATSVAGRGEANRKAVAEQFSRVGTSRPAKHLDESGLARSVLAEKGANLAATSRHRNAVNREKLSVAPRKTTTLQNRTHESRNRRLPARNPIAASESSGRSAAR